MTTLTLHRILKAPRAKVYECWTTPEHMVHWFMPKPHYLSDITVELRPGGAYNSTMHVDGNAMPSEGCVLDAVPNEKFVFTNMMSRDFQPIADPGIAFTATIELKDHPDGCEYLVTARHPTAEDSDRHEAMGFSAGWGTVAQQLGDYAAALVEHPERQMTLTRHYKATPEQVWAAWTDPNVLPRWFGPEGMACTTKEIDLRDGGVWRFDMIGHGMTFPNRHRDFIYTPHSRIRFLMDDDDDSTPFEVVVTLVPEDGGTRLTQRMTFADVASKVEAEGYNAVELGNTTLAKLARELGEA